MNQLYLDIFLRMCKRAVFSIVTLLQFIRETGAELHFILIRMIQLLDPIMSLITHLAVRTVVISLRAEFKAIHTSSASVLTGVVINTVLRIMLPWYLANFSFELL
jgi:hypothetical protein